MISQDKVVGILVAYRTTFKCTSLQIDNYQDKQINPSSLVDGNTLAEKSE